MTHDLFLYVLLVAVGFVAGVLNVIAGGGSFLTLPMLIFAGLPPTVANATNRVGVLAQNIGGVLGFHRYKVLNWRWGLRVSVPSLLGASVGVWGALRVGDTAFQRILAVLMLAVTLWTLLRPQNAAVSARVPHAPALAMFGFFLAGIYGGFVQAGVGFFILAITSLAGLDLVRGNAIKVLVVLLLTILSLVVFAWEGKVEWSSGLVLGAGNLTGGLTGVRLTVLKGHRWVNAVVTTAVVVFAIKLLAG
ncbi:MAG: sulfite exporter TauE/SafE family protein [Vicinamibacterales bacterium]